MPKAQILGYGDYLLAEFTLMLDVGPVVFSLLDGFPVKKLGFVVVNTNGFFFFLNKHLLKYSICFVVRGARNVLILLIEQVYN